MVHRVPLGRPATATDKSRIADAQLAAQLGGAQRRLVLLQDPDDLLLCSVPSGQPFGAGSLLLSAVGTMAAGMMVSVVRVVQSGVPPLK